MKVNYKPLPWQEAAHQTWPEFPYLVLTGGVLTGKTDWAGAEQFDGLTTWDRGGLWWWIAGQNFQIDAMWQKFKPIAKTAGARTNDHPYSRALFPGGGRMMGVTAHNWSKIRSFHPTVIIVDELQTIHRAAIRAIQLRFVNVKRVLLMSAVEDPPHPDLVRFARFGDQHLDGKWAHISVGTDEAGLVTAEEIEHQRKILPPRVFRASIQGHIVEGGGEGSVFRHVDRASENDAMSRALGPKPKERYVLGYDPAKSRDYGVAAVMKVSTGQIVCFRRWQSPIDYHQQAKLVAALSFRYNKARVVSDATGPGGEAVLEILRKTRYEEDGLPLTLDWEGVTFDNTRKGELAEEISVRFESEKLWLPAKRYGDDYEAAIGEFYAYRVARSGSGLTFTYAAPEGQHDDCVSAVMLCLARLDRARAPVSWLERSSSLPKPALDAGAVAVRR